MNSYTSDFCSDTSHSCALGGGSYNPDFSNSKKLINTDFSITYIDGTRFAGASYTDILRFAGQGLENVQFAIAHESNLRTGIFGIGYAQHQRRASLGEEPYPSIFDLLLEKKLIDIKAFSLWMDKRDGSTGHILFGDIDDSKYQGKLVTVPIERSKGEYREFRLRLTDITLSQGKKQIKLPLGKLHLPATVQVDSGTPYTYLPSGIVMNMWDIVKPAALSSDGTVALVDCALLNSNLKFHFTFGGFGRVSVPIASFLSLPTTRTSRTGGKLCIFEVVANEEDLRFLGHNFLSSLYTFFDMTNHKISFAPVRGGGDVAEFDDQGDLWHTEVGSEAGGDGLTDMKLAMGETDPLDLENLELFPALDQSLFEADDNPSLANLFLETTTTDANKETFSLAELPSYSPSLIKDPSNINNAETPSPNSDLFSSTLPSLLGQPEQPLFPTPDTDISLFSESPPVGTGMEAGGDLFSALPSSENLNIPSGSSSSSSSASSSSSSSSSPDFNPAQLPQDSNVFTSEFDLEMQNLFT
jgi:hypothetical protein